jgi:hypothetical protein
VSPSPALLHEGRKYMWDGQPYETREDASKALDAYQRDGFDVQLAEEAGTFFVYTRRVVTQVTVTAS